MKRRRPAQSVIANAAFLDIFRHARWAERQVVEQSMDSLPQRWTRRSFLAKSAASASLIPLSATMADEQDAPPSPSADTAVPTEHFGDYQSRIYERGTLRLKPEWPISIEELEAEAKRVLSPQSYNYAAGGAGAEDTMKANLDAFKK